jgi:L-malate glycosyltransferase
MDSAASIVTDHGVESLPPQRAAARSTGVMHVVLSLSPGGTERLVIEIARRVAQRTNVYVCCLDDAGDWAEELTAHGVPVMTLGRRPGFHPQLGYELAKLTRAFGVEVLHCHHYSPFVYGQLAAVLRPSLRVIFTEHGRLSDAPPSPKRRVVNPWLGRLPARIFAVSADLRRHMIAEGLPSDRIEVLYNGIDAGHAPTDADRHQARRLLGMAADDFVIGTVGRLDAVKDLPTMIRALRDGRSAGRTWRLAIVGDGPERAALADLVNAHGMADAVHFAGYRRDVRALLPALDLYVNTSIHEGVSLTILEAMAASLPVVATDVGGNPEVVVHDRTGLLVPARNAAACADAIHAIAMDAGQRISMGQAGRARVVESFSVDQMVRRYVQSYFGVN